MIKSIYPISAILLLLFISFLAHPVLAKKVNEPKQDDVDYVWVVIKFNFSCPNSRSSAIFKMKWEKRKERRFEYGCSGKTYVKGVVLRFSTKERPPLSELKISTSNCTVSQYYTEPPPELEDKKRYYVNKHLFL